MKSLINRKVIWNVLGSLIFITGLLMSTSLLVSLYYNEDDFDAILISSIISISTGILIKLSTRKHKNDEIKRRDGFLIVAMGWVSMAIFGSLPYVFSGAIPSYTNAFFETISGLTTTGATILENIESLPHGILFWRSMTQWIGGMGIIVLTIAVLPLLGVGGMELFVAEAPGPTKDKLHPRIKETAKRLWLIYLTLTIVEALCLKYAGMGYFDSINHAFTTMSSGGFSTKQDSIAAFNSPFIEYIIIFFMILAGTNFVLLYYGAKFQFKKIWNNDEFKWYIGTVLVLFLLLAPIVTYYIAPEVSLSKGYRDTLFQIVSIITTTGYATADYTTWSPFLTFVFFLMLFSGASAGSTSGGMKIVRLVLLIKNGFLEFKRRIHPNAIVPVQLNGRAVPAKTINNLMAFVFLFLATFVTGSLALTALGVEFDTAISAVATSMANVGPGISEVGPSHTFNALPDAGKWILSFLMLMGRLELFTIAILFTPYFWKRN